ncbi:MAG: ADP-ribosylglycohydrolase family protein [Bacillota bacterium]
MIKAWQWELEQRRQAVPRILTEEEQTWDSIFRVRDAEDERIRIYWRSEVPGSGAPECLVAGAIQSMENRGRRVEEAEALFADGLKALETGDLATLHRLTSLILKTLQEAPRDEGSPYWKFHTPTSWEEHIAAVRFPDPVPVSPHTPQFTERVYAGWLAQVCGGALGTALEGYTTDRLMEVFGDIRGYVRKPNTFNDDITYELAFLKAFEYRGYHVTSQDIAEEWVALIPFGWSAEDIALRNLKLGVYPPESGRRSNPFSEWIGAQMRGTVCGLVAPGDPRQAARLAWIDGVISHEGNGVLGEVFNAVMTSLAFVRGDIRGIVQNAIDLLPPESEYHSVVREALGVCREASDWLAAWRKCEKRLERYNWVHAYPNAAAEVVALWFGNGDFDETMRIVALAGQDVDCNAAQVATVLGVALGPSALGEHWTKPIGDRLQTYVRGMEELSIAHLARWNVDLVRRALARYD